MRKTLSIFALGISLLTAAQTTDSTSTLSLLFMGDIMGHDTQIASALQTNSTYDYTEVFEYLKPVISEVDVAIANLEVTLAGPPFKGYPQFSSPDALAVAAKNAGIDIFGTANNHSIDRGKKGILRTLQVLDSLEIPHTGTFRNQEEKESTTPLLIEQNGFKLALVNYTYGTNGIPVPSPTIVNLNNHTALATDIKKAKAMNPDKVILFIHWGLEYQHEPNSKQTELAEFCFKQGADIIIGSHPHVVQKSKWLIDTTNNSEQFITYSMGNFVSNQRKRYTDGGQMIRLVLEKHNNEIRIKESGHYLTWVYTPIIEGKKHFHILPCAKYELQPDFFISPEHFDKMKIFIADSRNLLNTQNKKVREYIYYKGEWSNE
ncbi:MAG: CapA family protein [Salinivirgaceae bacterium]|jgi:poly-gamma-glutamate capsule biosynthesis protein CapA/YwtB (metallophosphatase superfamily)|nr:CapA family protein [Salinivirgaceae bacterium]